MSITRQEAAGMECECPADPADGKCHRCRVLEGLPVVEEKAMDEVLKTYIEDYFKLLEPMLQKLEDDLMKGMDAFGCGDDNIRAYIRAEIRKAAVNDLLEKLSKPK